jgi:flagellar biosynthesis/type III secretory pathway M-ring protein FliF/YscJ
MQAALANTSSSGGLGENLLLKSDENRDPSLESLSERRAKGPRLQLQKLVDFDEEHAAEILKSWLRQGANG